MAFHDLSFLFLLLPLALLLHQLMPEKGRTPICGAAGTEHFV